MLQPGPLHRLMAIPRTCVWVKNALKLNPRLLLEGHIESQNRKPQIYSRKLREQQSKWQQRLPLLPPPGSGAHAQKLRPTPWIPATAQGPQGSEWEGVPNRLGRRTTLSLSLLFSLRWPQPNSNFGSVTSDCVWLWGMVENVAVGLPRVSDPTTQADGTS